MKNSISSPNHLPRRCPSHTRSHIWNTGSLSPAWPWSSIVLLAVRLLIGVLLHGRQGDAAGGERVGQGLQGKTHLVVEMAILRFFLGNFGKEALYHLKRRGALGKSSLSSFAKSPKTRQRRRFHIVCQTSIWTLLYIGDDGGDDKDNGHGPTVNWSPIQLVGKITV